MSTLVELFSVVIPRHVLDASFPGGTEAYLAAAARHPATRFAVADERLTSVSLASPEEVATFTEPLERMGLTTADDRTSAIACVDQHFGPVAPCPWLRWRRHDDGYTSCWLEWTEPGELAAPEGWMPERLRAAQRLEAARAASFAPPVSAAPAAPAANGSGGSNGNGAHHDEPVADRRPVSLTPRDIARLEPVDVELAARYDRMATPVRMAAILDVPEPMELGELPLDGLETSEAWGADAAELPALPSIADDVVYGVEDTAEPMVGDAMVDDEMVDDAIAHETTVQDVTAEPTIEEPVVAEAAEEVPELATDYEPSPSSPPAVEVLDEEVRGVEAMFDEPAAESRVGASTGDVAEDAAPLDRPMAMAMASFEATLADAPVVEPATFARALDAAFAEAEAEAEAQAEAEARAAAEPVAEVEAAAEPEPEPVAEPEPIADAEAVTPGATAAFMAAVEREVEELFSQASRRPTPLSVPFVAPHVDRPTTLTPQPEAAPPMSALSLSVAPPQDAAPAATEPSMLDELRRMLRDKGYRFAHDPEHSALFFQVTGTRASYHGCAAVDEQNRLVWLYTQFPVRVPEARRATAVELLTRANHGLPVGNFEFDYRDGEVRFKAYADGGEGCFAAAQASRMLRASLAACDRYHDALMSVIYGGASATEAYESARAG